MRMIDLYVPAVEGFDIKLPFDEAYELVVEALSALGEDYQAILRKAREERWIDVYENEGTIRISIRGAPTARTPMCCSTTRKTSIPCSPSPTRWGIPCTPI